MTLDEAIKHCQYISEKPNHKYADEHKQLVQWLQELQEIKKKQTTEEWLRNASFEELTKTIYEWYTKGYTRGRLKVARNPITDVIKWLKQPESERSNHKTDEY